MVALIGINNQNEKNFKIEKKLLKLHAKFCICLMMCEKLKRINKILNCQINIIYYIYPDEVSGFANIQTQFSSNCHASNNPCEYHAQRFNFLTLSIRSI